jgi:hypothetical protein
VYYLFIAVEASPFYLNLSIIDVANPIAPPNKKMYHVPVLSLPPVTLIQICLLSSYPIVPIIVTNHAYKGPARPIINEKAEATASAHLNAPSIEL